jgi:hypothetical protein
MTGLPGLTVGAGRCVVIGGPNASLRAVQRPAEVEAPGWPGVTGGAEPTGPGGTGGDDFVVRGEAHRSEIQSGVAPGSADRRFPARIERRDALDAVRWHDRGEDLQPTARREGGGHTGEGVRVQTEGATQQRAPWERDGDEIRAAGERRVGERLGPRGKEHGVCRTAACRSSGRLGHRGRGGVHAKHEGRGLGARPGEHGPAVTGTDIGDHPVGPGDQAGDLADVDFDDAPADDLSHGRQSTLGR